MTEAARRSRSVSGVLWETGRAEAAARADPEVNRSLIAWSRSITLAAWASPVIRSPGSSGFRPVTRAPQAGERFSRPLPPPGCGRWPGLAPAADPRCRVRQALRSLRRRRVKNMCPPFHPRPMRPRGGCLDFHGRVAWNETLTVDGERRYTRPSQEVSSAPGQRRGDRPFESGVYRRAPKRITTEPEGSPSIRSNGSARAPSRY